MSRRRGIKKKRTSSKIEMDEDLEMYQPLDPHLFLTKKDFIAQNLVPACPIVPPKLRKCYGRFALNANICGRAKLLTFCPEQQERLSPWYQQNQNENYFDQVFYRKFKMGEGSFGSVYKAICKDDNKLYAVKHFNGNHPKNSKYIEVENMEKLGFHKNLLHFYMAWEEGDNVYIKMECCQMSLAQYSKINHDISENQLHEILHDVTQGLIYIHSKNYMHLDVKPDNILIERGHYKLGDFGLLYNFDTNNKGESSTSEGDSKYLAPEILNGVYTPNADIFALGITMLELATDFIMPSNGSLWHALRSGGMPSNLSEKISDKFQMLIHKMMAHDLEKRPSAREIETSSIIIGVVTKDLLIPRTDYAGLLAVENSTYPTLLHADIRRVLSDIADSSGDTFHTPINRSVIRKIAFSPGGDGVPRRMTNKTTTPTKDYPRCPRMKLFL